MKRREEGQIIKRGENKYVVRWSSNKPQELTASGRRKQPSETVYGDYAAAHSFLSNKLKELKAGPDSNPQSPQRTFKSYVEKEWAQYVEDHWKGSTKITQGNFVTQHIVTYFGEMLLSEIKPEHISAFQTAMANKKTKLAPNGLGKKTRRNLHAILTKMFNHAVDLELIGRNPVKKGVAPKLEKMEKPALTEQQLALLFPNLPPRYKAFYVTLALTGIRTGEALGLKWADIDFASRELHIRRKIYRGKEDTPKTAASKRSRPISPELYQSLLNHKAMSAYTSQADYVFCSSSGRPANPDQLREALQKVLRDKLGIHLGPREDGLHLLRHSSGSVVYRTTGGDLKATQEWLGHSSSRITADVYVHMRKDSQQKVAQALGKAVFTQPLTVPPEQVN
jgi:integrase